MLLYEYSYRESIPEEGVANFDPAHNSGESFRGGFVWTKPFQYLSFSLGSKDLSSKWKSFELHRCYFFEKSNILVFWLHFLTKSHCNFIKENMVSSTYLPRNLSEGAQILNPSSLKVSGGFLFCRSARIEREKLCAGLKFATPLRTVSR